jgi:hypothetical protein
MKRSIRTLALCFLGAAAGCSSSDSPEPADDKVSITMFQAAPDSIEAGQTAMLKVTIDPPDAQVTITEVGDMTARSEIPVHPTTTTTYHLTAINGTARAEAHVEAREGLRRDTRTLCIALTSRRGVDELEVVRCVVRCNLVQVFVQVICRCFVGTQLPTDSAMSYARTL